MFTKPCFIRKNTPELRKKLEKLGYIPSTMNNLLEKAPTLVAMELSRGYPKFYGEPYIYAIVKTFENQIKFIDCGTNENLFLAIAALRDDTDRNQWFVHKSGYHWWRTEFDSFEKCFYDINDDHELKLEDFHKATVQEIIEHFNIKDK